MTTDPEAKRQADELTDAIDDIIHERTSGGGGSGVAAAEIVSQLPQLLYQAGWMPPETLERVQDWATRTRNLPDRHVNRDVLTSHLVELADILHRR
jgi:hypothetical protein